MSAALPDRQVAPAGSLPWLLVGLGFIAMFLPSYWDAAWGLWQTDEMAHAPIVLCVVVWACWRERHQLASAPKAPWPWLGWSLFCGGVLLYALARIFAIGSIEFGAHVVVVVGAMLVMWGPALVRAAWFPLLYSLFLMPLPASMVGAVTGPLKHWITVIVVDLLHYAGLPIARLGVVISIGPYQLLVADACSGLNSMFGLAAIGTLYMYVTARQSRLHNGLMFAAILPIAFAANIVRVVSLVLITFYFGDEAGQGFLHGTAGVLLFVVALTMFALCDSAISRLMRSR